MHVSPRTVGFLRAIGHDVVRVNEVMPVISTDETIVLRALDDRRVLRTQDLRFSGILALVGQRAPSLISLRLSSSRIEFVNATLERVLLLVERDVAAGAIVTVEDSGSERADCLSHSLVHLHGQGGTACYRAARCGLGHVHHLG
jgi:predicted nuclease of predicted toxin-antitoxin system